MAQRTDQPRPVVATALIGAGALWAYRTSGPILYGAEVNVLSAGGALIAAGCGLSLIGRTLGAVGAMFDWLAARKPTGLKGTAGFIENLSELGNDYKRKGWGPYLGGFKGQPIISDFSSVAMTCGTSGSNKSVGVVETNVLSIRHSKAVTDLKSSLTCKLAAPLRKRGERVRVLNFAGINADIIGPTNQYNPTVLIADCYKREGGLLEVGDVLSEMVHQLYPEPENGGQNDNGSYFRSGSRSLIHIAIETSVLIMGDDATLADALDLLLDRESLLRHMQWAAGQLELTPPASQGYSDSANEGGRQTMSFTASMPLEEAPWAISGIHDPKDLARYIADYRRRAIRVSRLLSEGDSRTADPFLEGAQTSMNVFSSATRAHKVTGGSDCRFSEMKDGEKATTFFFVADPNALKSQGRLIALVQFCMFQELKRHPRKDVPCTLIADEAANFVLDNLDGILTFGRGFGLRVWAFLQNFSAFRKAYSEDTLQTLLSEAEIAQFLPHTRQDEVIRYIQERLGEKSVMVKRKRGSHGKGGTISIDGTDYSEEARPLMTKDEIRRCQQGILFIRNNKAALVDIPPISAIAPFRKIVEIDPFHGKKWLLPVKLRIRRSDGVLHWLGRLLRQERKP